MLPDTSGARALAEDVLARVRSTAADTRCVGEERPDWRVVHDRFELSPGDAYLDRALDAEDPVGLFGDVDVVHSLTRFAVPTVAPRVVATVHDVAPLACPPYKRETLAMTCRALDGLRRADAMLLAVSEATRRDLVQRASFEEAMIDVVPPGVSERFLASTVALEPAAEPELLTVGGAGENKNLARLVEAVAILRCSRPVRLTMVGARAWGYRELLGELDPSLRDATWIRHLDYVDDTRLSELYRRSVVVVPSLHEGFGLPVLEAMASGATVACSDIPVFREVAGEVAFRFDPRDPSAIARVLAEALDDPERREDRIRRGSERARRFRWDRTIAQVVERYARAMSRPKSSAVATTADRGSASTRVRVRHGEPMDVATIAFSSAHDAANDHFDLIDRLLSSLFERTDPTRFRLHVGCNDVSPRVRDRIDSFALRCSVRIVEGDAHRDGSGATAYPKYPLMRRLLAGVRSSWFVWFDDDSYVTRSDWLDALVERIREAEQGRAIGVDQPGAAAAATGGVAQFGKLADAPMMNPPPGWIERASWRDPGMSHETVTLDDGTSRIVCPFVVGGFFAMRSDAMRRADVPDPRLFHNGGDWTTGLALAHKGYSVADHRYGVAINDAPRRGIHADRWYPPGRAAKMQEAAIRADQCRFDEATSTPTQRTTT